MSQIQLSNNSESGEISPLLKVTDLSVHFQSTSGTFGLKKSTIKAVDGISFSMNPSETVAIVGESGSGKTTLARCILGVVNAESGSIWFKGKDLNEIKRKNLRDYWRQVQIIYQDPFESLTPRMTVYETVATPLRELVGMKSRDETTATVKKLLEEVGLDPSEIMYRYPHQLSGGQRQRVNIARALAPNPSLLVADEPITMLDAAQRINILNLLSDLRKERKLTLLLITHDLASARMMCERILVMYVGTLVEMGNTNMVLTKPSHPYVELILGALPSLTTPNPYDNLQLSWIEESVNITNGCIFEPRCKYKLQTCKEIRPRLTERTDSHYVACNNPLNP